MSSPPPAPSVRYGDHPDQVANLHLPAADGGPWPCVALVHGGFWRDGWDRTLMTGLARDLAGRGIASWNVEYRRVGSGGGWPDTFDDVGAALDALVDVPAVDVGRVVTCGHSAGGHLALWVAGRHRVPGESPRVRPLAAVAQAGVPDLVLGSREGVGDGAVDGLMGGAADEVPERYSRASPAALLPLGVPQLLLHGTADDVVPARYSQLYAEGNPDAELVLLDGVDHVDVIDPAHRAWGEVVERLPRYFGLRR